VKGGLGRFDIAEPFSFRLLTDNIVFEILDGLGVDIEKSGACMERFEETVA